jgi:hypothetical protein
MQAYVSSISLSCVVFLFFLRFSLKIASNIDAVAECFGTVIYYIVCLKFENWKLCKKLCCVIDLFLKKSLI